MNYKQAMIIVNTGLVVTRDAWAEKGYELGLASDPINGVATLVLVRGKQLWRWHPQDDDKTAIDWKLAGDEPRTFLGGGVREVL